MTQTTRPFLPEHMGLNFERVEHGSVTASLEICSHHMAPNGYLHAGTVVTLADSACGYGCTASLPEGARSFTTVELKSNFLGTALEGTIACEARLVHAGRSTQLWDAEVIHRNSGKRIALFRCTQMILYPR